MRELSCAEFLQEVSRMVKKELYTLKGYNREDFNITGYSFGSGEKAACIVGAIRGNEYQHQAHKNEGS